MGKDTEATTPHSAEEIKKWYDNELQQVKQFRDITKASTKKIQSYNKESVVSYLQNPARNETKLRELSEYLFTRSQLYQRLIMYYATLFNFDARQVIPLSYSLTNKNNDAKILKSYYNTLKMLNNWNINGELLKTSITCLKDDVSYNIAYYDSTGLFLYPMDPDYCRIYGQYPDGSFAFAVDMTYFRGNQEYLIEALGEPFTSMQNEYLSGGSKWVLVPDEYSACFKFRSYDWQLILPPLSGIFLSLIDLEDAMDVSAVLNQQEIYKLIWLELETITGAKAPDQWKVSPAIAVEYFNRLIEEALPDYTSAAIVPGKLNTISFSDSSGTSENTKITKAEESVLNSAGGAQILLGTELSGSTAFNAAIRADTEYAISTLLPQYQGFLNRIMGYAVNNPSKIKFFHVGRLMTDDFRDKLLKNAQYGLPTKLSIMSLTGMDELESLALNHLEEDILQLGDRFDDPLSSSFTSTSDGDAVKPTLSDTEITDDGEASRDKNDNSGG